MTEADDAKAAKAARAKAAREKAAAKAAEAEAAESTDAKTPDEPVLDKKPEPDVVIADDHHATINGVDFVSAELAASAVMQAQDEAQPVAVPDDAPELGGPRSLDVFAHLRNVIFEELEDGLQKSQLLITLESLEAQTNQVLTAQAEAARLADPDLGHASDEDESSEDEG